MKLNSFDRINVDEFHYRLNCRGLPNDLVSVLEPTKIKSLKPRELNDLSYFLKMNVGCDADSIISFVNDDMIVSGCRMKFKNSTNGVVYTYNDVFFIDEQELTI